MPFKFRSSWVLLVAVAVAGSLSIGSAASPAIGVIKASGSFRVDDAAVYRSSTLFEGTVIDVESVPSEAWLDGGARLRLAPGSRGRVYQNRLLLEKGAGQMWGSERYAIVARSLRIVPAGATSQVRVALNPASHIEVAALDGAAQVWSAQGFLVANILRGRALDLDPQAAEGASEFRLTGCLQKKGGRFILTDETTNVTVELQGAGLDKQVGNSVEVAGATVPDAKPAAGATQVVRVSDLKAAGGKCKPAAGKAAAGAAAAGAALSKATVVAIVGGVAAAGTVGGLAISGAFEGEKEPISR